jgi:GGDEF domain-containing protein
VVLMTDPRFYDAASGLLTREAFSFMVDHQVEHAKRAQEFLTLVVYLVERRWRELVMDRDWREHAVAADDWIVKEMARLIRHGVRSTDLIARTASGAISLLLVGVDGEGARGVIERVNVHLRRYRATPTLQISVGAACCPTDAVRSDDLIHTARGRAARGEVNASRADDEDRHAGRASASAGDEINGISLNTGPQEQSGQAAAGAPAGAEPQPQPSFVERRRTAAQRSMREN